MGAEVANSTLMDDTALQPSPSLLCGARRQNQGELLLLDGQKEEAQWLCLPFAAFHP